MVDTKRAQWTEEEQRMLARHHAIYGNSWHAIAKFLDDRTANDIKNYWHATVRCVNGMRRSAFLHSYVLLLRNLEGAEADRQSALHKVTQASDLGTINQLRSALLHQYQPPAPAQGVVAPAAVGAGQAEGPDRQGPAIGVQKGHQQQQAQQQGGQQQQAQQKVQQARHDRQQAQQEVQGIPAAVQGQAGSPGATMAGLEEGQKAPASAVAKASSGELAGPGPAAGACSTSSVGEGLPSGLEGIPLRAMAPTPPCAPSATQCEQQDAHLPAPSSSQVELRQTSSLLRQPLPSYPPQLQLRQVLGPTPPPQPPQFQQVQGQVQFPQLQGDNAGAGRFLPPPLQPYVLAHPQPPARAPMASAFAAGGVGPPAAAAAAPASACPPLDANDCVTPCSSLWRPFGDDSFDGLLDARDWCDAAALQPGASSGHGRDQGCYWQQDAHQQPQQQQPPPRWQQQQQQPQQRHVQQRLQLQDMEWVCASHGSCAMQVAERQEWLPAPGAGTSSGCYRGDGNARWDAHDDGGCACLAPAEQQRVAGSSGWCSGGGGGGAAPYPATEMQQQYVPYSAIRRLKTAPPAYHTVHPYINSVGEQVRRSRPTMEPPARGPAAASAGCCHTCQHVCSAPTGPAMAAAPPQQQQGTFPSGGMPVAQWDCRPAGPSSSTTSECFCYSADQQQQQQQQAQPWQRSQQVQQQHKPDWSGPCRCGGCLQQWEQQQWHKPPPTQTPQQQQPQERWQQLPPPQQQQRQWYQPPQQPFLPPLQPLPSPPPQQQQQQWHQPLLQAPQQQAWLQAASSVHAMCAPARNDSGISSDGDNYTYGAAVPLVSLTPSPFDMNDMPLTGNPGLLACRTVTEDEQVPQTDAAVVMGLDAELLHGLPEWGSCDSSRAYSA